MLRIAVIGVGHQGKLHIRFLREMEGVDLSVLVDRDPGRASQAGAETKVSTSTSFHEQMDAFDAAVIAVPTIDHFAIASELMEAGKHVLIEKPVTVTTEDAQKLSAIAKRKGVVAHVGFPERFNPAVRKAMPQITKPLFVETHRLGVFSPRSLDIDVVLDLMIHDLDLLYLFLKEEPTDIEAVGIPILSKQIDIANARIKFPGKCVVNLTASRVSANRMRKMRLFQPYSYLSLDLAQQSFNQFSLQPNMCNAGFPEIVRNDYQPEKPEHPLQLELMAFRDAILKGGMDGVSVSDAIPSLRMAIAVKQKFQAV